MVNTMDDSFPLTGLTENERGKGEKGSIKH